MGSVGERSWQFERGSGFQLVSQTCATLAVLTRLTVRLGGRW